MNAGCVLNFWMARFQNILFIEINGGAQEARKGDYQVVSVQK